MTISRQIRRAASAVMDMMCPPSCVSCGADGGFLCVACLQNAVRIDVAPQCRACAMPLQSGGLCGACATDPPPLARLDAVYAYDGPIRAAIHAFKYSDLRALAPELGTPMAEALRRRRRQPQALLPVPLHPGKLRRRGYNQAELLASHVSRQTGVPVAADILRRVRDSPPQARAGSMADRAAQVAGAFETDSRLVGGLDVALVDDVCATGSTIHSAAQVLLDAGAARVSGLVLAKEL
ncbi:MAG: ComF family protein [Chloroflexota bacterium]